MRFAATKFRVAGAHVQDIESMQMARFDFPQQTVANAFFFMGIIL
jgi:hypothetical protein